MSYKHLGIILIILLALTLIWGCAKKDPNVVAKVGDWTLTTDEFRDIAAKRWGNPENASRKSVDELAELLEEVVINRLKVVDGYNKGLDNDPDVQKEFEKELNRSAISKLYRMEIRDQLISEEEVREFYEKDREEIHASHILLLVKPDEDDSDAKRRIDKIHKEAIRADADFAELAGKYSEDQSTQDGDLGWFRWGVMVQPFQEAAFALNPGEISNPVRTDYGWHIINLHGRREREVAEAYEDVREKIIGQVSKQRHKELAEKAESYINMLKEERSYKYMEGSAEIIVNLMKDKLKSKDPLSLLTEEQQNIVLVSLDGGETDVTVRDLLTYVKTKGTSSRALESVEQLENFSNSYITQEFLLPVQARNLGCFDDPEIEEKAKETRDRKIRQIAQKTVVTDKADPSDEDAKKYFDENPSEFMTEEQFTLLEILLSDENKAKELAERVKNGENMRELAMTHSERRRAEEKKGVLGPIRKTQHGEIGRIAAKSEIGELVGPIYLKSTKRWSLFKVISREEPKAQEYDKIKNKVKSNLRIKLRKDLETTWTAELKSKHKYHINKTALRNLFEDVKTEVAAGKETTHEH